MSIFSMGQVKIQKNKFLPMVAAPPYFWASPAPASGPLFDGFGPEIFRKMK